VEFALIFIREYGIIIFFCLVTNFIFFSKTEKIVFFYLRFVFIIRMLILRRVYPRFRYDKLIFLSWFKFLPISCFLFLINLFIYLMYSYIF
jgi:NADH:ubiquinone oxidoreductase subunit H